MGNNFITDSLCKIATALPSAAIAVACFYLEKRASEGTLYLFFPSAFRFCEATHSASVPSFLTCSLCRGSFIKTTERRRLRQKAACLSLVCLFHNITSSCKIANQRHDTRRARARSLSKFANSISAARGAGAGWLVRMPNRLSRFCERTLHTI